MDYLKLSWRQEKVLFIDKASDVIEVSKEELEKYQKEHGE
jgi:hypothetical protein